MRHRTLIILLLAAAWSAAVGSSPRFRESQDAEAATVPGHSYELVPLASGVYAAVRRVSAGSVDSNSLIIINDADVVVVDTGLYRADARRLLADIRRLTNKPVRDVINTHSHDDHVAGNEVFLDAFPGVEFLSHAAARDEIAHHKSREETAGAYRTEIANLQKRLDGGMDSDGKPFTPGRREHVTLTKTNLEFWIADMSGARDVLPTLTVEDSLVLHRGARTIEIKYFGKGHTAGDLVVYLPNERIVATGDLVVHPVPFGFSPALREWPATLRRLEALEAAIIVPGHGEIQRDWRYVDRQIALFESTWEQVKKAVDAGADLEAARRAVNRSALSQAFGATSPEMRDELDYLFLDPAIDAAFEALRPRRPPP
jgi:cyclase